ncbi:GntR family transcriptional regulator [Falsochrobactrum sp. TDYN1]|uniref:GntR family transcriptional regulator n=1 Tax=Falsochrobactrum tianjinense TaxID=2706015 RepID=A0A949UT93_9HYPH|nr:GntR family transcriptional regulator [Falsochrobactrum sp. TDYN1]MBV2142126.1 GntR family transcriptional regulator [Falsochrobactrum sp. TDYN1]
MKETLKTLDTAEISPNTDVRRSADSSEKAYKAIRQLLVEFRLKPEERLNEVQLSRRLGVSRTPIREALNRLASEGFVSAAPNRGFFVRSLNIEGLLDLYELRIIIECAAFRLMCQRANDVELARLKDYWDSQKEGYNDQPPDEILAADEGFHLLIAELSGNPELVNTLESINARIRFIRRIQIEHSTHDLKLISAHSNIVAAAMARDVEQGINILQGHIEMTVSATREALKDALLKVYSQSESAL